MFSGGVSVSPESPEHYSAVFTTVPLFKNGNYTVEILNILWENRHTIPDAYIFSDIFLVKNIQIILTRRFVRARRLGEAR